MFIAKISVDYSVVRLGPTDTRDEAARLARAWIEAHPCTWVPDVFRHEVKGVDIEQVADAAE